ncbi:MAG: glycosyltransferase [Bacteroidota bacterium]
MKNNLLIIGNVWPEPKSSAAGTRILQVIDLFLDQNFEITFVSAASKSEFSFNLESLGVKTIDIELNSSSFDEFVKTLNPQIVVFDRFMIEEQFGWRVRENCPNAQTILDTEDLHLLRFARQKAVKEKREFEKDDLFSLHAKREIASILRCDLNLIISELEMEILKTEFRINPEILFYLPFLIKEYADTNPRFYERTDFTFIGNFFHEPNIDSAFYLKEKIWPLLRKKLPKAKLKIYGAYMPEKILNLNKENENFLVLGRIEDASEVYKSSRVFLAPLRFGAGQKGKLLETMLYGIPNVTSSIGAESMQGNLAWNGFITDDVNEFVNHAVNVYTDESLWNQSKENGFKILEHRFLNLNFSFNLFEKINYLQQNLVKHRNENFLGQILQQDSINATKFMSKWIEEKNKIKK